MVRALGEQLDIERDKVLVVDDNSPDGTGDLLDQLSLIKAIQVLLEKIRDAINRVCWDSFN